MGVGDFIRRTRSVGVFHSIYSLIGPTLRSTESGDSEEDAWMRMCVTAESCELAANKCVCAPTSQLSAPFKSRKKLLIVSIPRSSLLVCRQKKRIVADSRAVPNNSHHRRRPCHFPIRPTSFVVLRVCVCAAGWVEWTRYSGVMQNYPKRYSSGVAVNSVWGEELKQCVRDPCSTILWGSAVVDNIVHGLHFGA